MEEDSESSEGKFMPDNHKKVLVALLGVVIVVAAGIYLMDGNTSIDTPEDNSTAPAEDNSEETTTFTGVKASDIEGEITDVTITDIKVEPAGPTIAPEDGIRFVNKAGVDLKFSFDRELESFQLPAGDSVIVDPTKIIYYDVEALNDSAEFRAPAGTRINVQR